MNDENERQQAAEALATVRAHQERTRRAARVPWWVYLAMFVLAAGAAAANDFIGLGGAKLLSAVIMVALIVVLVITFAGRSAPLSRVRGVQPRQSFIPWVFGVVVIVGGVGAWLITRYGAGFADDVAGSVGLRHYPNTVAGVLLGAAFTLLFALSQLLTGLSRRRTNP